MVRGTDESSRRSTRRSHSAPPDLVQSAASGDREAQQRLLTTYIVRIRRLVRRLVSNPADVEDLVQTACVQLLRSLPRFRGEASLGLWIDRITSRTVYKHYRSTRRRRRRLAFVSDPELNAEGTDEVRRMEAREGVRRARELVDALKPGRRIVFLLVVVEGRSLKETATILDLSLAATKSRLLRARRDIDSMLASQPALVELLRKPAGGSR